MNCWRRAKQAAPPKTELRSHSFWSMAVIGTSPKKMAASGRKRTSLDSRSGRRACAREMASVREPWARASVLTVVSGYASPDVSSFACELIRDSPRNSIKPRRWRGFLCALVQGCPLESRKKVSQAVSQAAGAWPLTHKWLTHICSQIRSCAHSSRVRVPTASRTPMACASKSARVALRSGGIDIATPASRASSRWRSTR